MERPYDYTAIVETEAGTRRTPLWSHARAMMFCDEDAFLLPAAAEAADARLVSFCLRCQRWRKGATVECDECGGPVDVVSATRHARP